MDDMKINKIVLVFDYNKLQVVMAKIYYTQTDKYGNSMDFTIREKNPEAIDYYKSKFAEQSNCRVADLESINNQSIEYVDVKKYKDWEDYSHPIVHLPVGAIKITTGKDKVPDANRKKKVGKIIITFVATTAVIAALGATAYTLKSLGDSQGRVMGIVNKIEATNKVDSLSHNELDSIVDYIEAENDDNKYQKEEIELNDRVLNGLVQNENHQRVITKAQGLFKNCFNDSPRMSYNQEDVYKYFMFISSLLHEGDTVNYSNYFGANIAQEMQGTYDRSLEQDPDFMKTVENYSNVSKGHKVSYYRIMYSAMYDDAQVFKGMDYLSKKIILEQFITIAKNVKITLKDADKPSWWAGYNEDKVIKEAEELLEQLKVKSAIAMENAEKTSRKM